MIWHILISESVSVYGRYVVGLLSVWVRDCRSVVGYDSSIVLMIGFQSVSCRLSVGLKSGDSIPNLTRNDPDMNPSGFTVSSATLSVADSWPIHWPFCRFCRFRVGLAGVTGVIPQSHRPNRHVTDLKPTKILKFGERSVYIRYWFGFVGLVSVYVRADKFVGERSFKHVWKISPRQIVGCLSVICRFGVGFVGERSGTCRS